MKFTLIICTFQRPESLKLLLCSVQEQILIPDQIVIVDGSLDDSSQELIRKENFPNLEYYKIEEKDRGLTKQRNIGITKVATDIEIVCFLDDDIVLTPQYFQNLINTYKQNPDAIGVGGYILNESNWSKLKDSKITNGFEYDGWVRELGSRNVLRKKLHLLSDVPPGFMPIFSNGFSTGFLPPSGKIYPVEYFMGGVSSYKKSLFSKLRFSTYFEGYGLYEDMDFCLRASRVGQLYVNTSAGLFHYHSSSGRPNRFNYGKMVIRNGWYVWRVKYPSPQLEDKLKWHAITLLLTFVRLGNIITTKDRREALTESMGRIYGWISLFFKKPKESTL